MVISATICLCETGDDCECCENSEEGEEKEGRETESEEEIDELEKFLLHADRRLVLKVKKTYNCAVFHYTAATVRHDVLTQPPELA